MESGPRRIVPGPAFAFDGRGIYRQAGNLGFFAGAAYAAASFVTFVP
ncbi:hypothetical protein SAMN04488069_105139 [Hymenobacter psychrophilus]|uniref:Uncharacterized protein n=1 Tax=Hymenobacter psychrophilus TaxID=651662 RepID=A0A1H3GR38_9BACT|nr:hypothetical protein SAMN04488069_105139 [Hymenobacter psychrophilus]